MDVGIQGKSSVLSREIVENVQDSVFFTVGDNAILRLQNQDSFVGDAPSSQSKDAEREKSPIEDAFEEDGIPWWRALDKRPTCIYCGALLLESELRLLVRKGGARRAEDVACDECRPYVLSRQSLENIQQE